MRRLPELSRATEAEVLERLGSLPARFSSAAPLASLLYDTLDTIILATGADFGNLQLVNPRSGALGIVAQRGCERGFLDFFSAVHLTGSACATALREGAVSSCRTSGATPTSTATAVTSCCARAPTRCSPRRS
jgi:hypothetical protein